MQGMVPDSLSVKATCVNGLTVLNWYADDACTTEITGKDLNEAMAAVLAEDRRRMDPPGMKDCLALEIGYDEYNKGIAQEECTVLMSMGYDVSCVARVYRNDYGLDADAADAAAAEMAVQESTVSLRNKISGCTGESGH